MIFRKYITYLRYYDWILFFCVLLLLSFSLAALYGIGTGAESAQFLNLKKQIVFVIIGLIFLITISFLDYNIFSSYAYLFYVGSGILLLVVLFFGVSFKGTTGWLDFYGFNLQPVELAKFSLLLVLAKMFSNKTPEEKNLRFVVKTGIITLIYFILVLRQPDFGSAMLLFFLWFGFLLFSGVKKTYIFSLIGILIISFFIGWMFFFKDYQKDRIITFFQPTTDPLGSGYHVRQSIIAIGSGNFFGKGLASGSQSQLKFIPASQTDFIFAVISEELGFVGSIVILFLYAVFFYRLLRITKKTNDDFALHFVLGVSILLFSQFMINVGMNLGIMPVTGISLPFLSYGGSFLIISLVLVGCIQSIVIRTVKYKV